MAEFMKSLFQDTAIKRFDLVCDQKFVPRVVQEIGSIKYLLVIGTW